MPENKPNASANHKGLGFLILAMLVISLQNSAVKGLGGAPCMRA